MLMKNKIQSKTYPRGTRTIWRYLGALFILFTFAIGNVWAAASTTTDGKYATGTIDFSTIGTLSGATTYWHNGVKFYSGNATSISANNTAWSTSVSIPAYVSNVTAGKEANKCKWGNGGTAKQYTQSGFACSQHTIGIHVNQACTLTIVVNKNVGSDTDDAGISASIDDVAYGTAYTSSTYKAAGSTALTVTSARADKTNASGRYTLTIVVGSGDLKNGEAVVKMFNGSSGSGAGKLFCWESITVTPAATPTSHTVTYKSGDGSGDDVVDDDATVVGGCPSTFSYTGYDFAGWKDGDNNDVEVGDAVTSDMTLTAQWTVHVAKYTVKYMDGTTLLGTEEVNVTEHPAGLAENPKKDCYTFAAWSPALSSVSGEENDEVEVNATWTPLYASSFNFGTTTDLTKDNIATKLATSNIFCSVGTGGSYDAGGTTGYLGYKFKNNGDYVTFIVQNGYEAIVTYGYTESGWQVNGVDAGVTVKTQAYVDKKYQANGSDLLLKLVNQSANSKTSVLTNIVIKATATGEDDATLSDLSVSGYTLDPSFDSATEDYTITKEYGAADPVVGDVTATPSVTGADADIAWDGTNHKFVITVTAKDGVTEKTYNITINEAEARKSLSRVLFSNGFDAFIDNTNHTVKAYYLAGTSAPTATTITAGAGTAGELAEGKITVTGADDSTVDYTVTLEAVTPNTTAVAEAAAAGEFAGDEAWVKNGLLVYGNAAGYSAGDKWYVNRRLKKDGDAADDQRVIAGWVRSYFFVGNASKFIMTVGGNRNLDYTIDGGTPVENVNVETLEIALTKGNHMIEIVSHQSSGDCRLSAPKLVELPPTFTVNYYPNGGSGAEIIVDDEATEVAAGTIFTAPASSIFAGWNTQADGNGVAYAAGDAVTENLTLHAQWRSYFTITYMDGETELDTENVFEGDAPVGIADPAKIGYDFAGWTLSGSDEVIDVTELSASTTVYAKWTAFTGCTLWYPAASGDALNVGDNVNSLTGSFGANVAVVGMKTAESSIAYNENGLFLSGGSADVISVTLNNDIAADTKISVTLKSGDTGARGLNLLTATGAKVKGGTKLGWDDATVGAVETFSYTVEAEDGLEGTNVFRLQRNNSVYLQCVKVESCGAVIVYHNVTSAVVPTGKGTVTLGASSVREGYTTTAEYSEIDPLYEFVSWSVSGAGASVENATANPATITVGTADAVVTLNLQLIPVKFTVNYYDGETPMGTEEVAVNENPTASEINTNKRHFTFQGWSETNGGSVVALNTITSDVAATIDLYAVYAPVACPTEGTVFSMEFDATKAPESTVKVAKDGGSIDLADYATISGGNAVIENTETSDKDAISTDGKFLLKATKEVMKIELECAIATGDVIRIPDNNAKYVLSTSNAKTGTYQAQTSSQHEFEATAAWNGVDDLYILYDGSSLNFTKVYVLRPYTISFDLQGHGDAIDAQKLVAGKKVVAPTAPTADGWDFGGWYKEAACTNAWDFDNDVVEGSISIYAKWSEHVTNDATLKSLKYGNTAIELEEGVYIYAVELAAAVASVPALSAETNAELATKVITNAEAFVAGQATSTVLVTAEDGETQLTYTVNFTKAAAVDLVDVTGNMKWDFSKANDGSAASSNLCNDEILANVAGIVNNSDFESDNIKATANKFTSNKLQASMIMFHTTVPGAVIVKFANTGSKSDYRYLVVNGVQTEAKSKDATMVTYAEYVPAGDVVLTVTTANEGNMFNFTSVEFKLDNDLEPARTDEWLAPGELGTICIPQGAVAVGADIYELVGSEPVYGKIVFETVKHMKPGKPYLFQAKGTRIDLILTDETPATEPDNSGAMKGTFEQTYLTELENVYYFAGNALWSCDDLSSLSVPANRAYVKMDEVNPAPQQAAPGRRRISMGVNGKNTATDIDQITNDQSQMTNKVIIDGQLFIIRGEKMYDVTGKLVK